MKTKIDGKEIEIVKVVFAGIRKVDDRTPEGSCRQLHWGIDAKKNMYFTHSFKKSGNVSWKKAGNNRPTTDVLGKLLA